MRAVWWLLKLGWLAATRVRRALGPAEGYNHAPLVDYLEQTSPEDVARVAELAAAYGRTFCGKCGAGPFESARRCSVCVQMLTDEMRKLNGEGRASIRELVAAAYQEKS